MSSVARFWLLTVLAFSPLSAEEPRRVFFLVGDALGQAMVECLKD